MNDSPSSLPGKILIIHDDGNSFNNPSVKCIIDLLLEKGHEIDLRYPTSDAPMPAYKGVRLLPFWRLIKKAKSFAYNRMCSWTLIHAVVFIENLAIYKKYDLVIGIDRQGLLEAKAIHDINGTPFVYISFEISFEEETSRRFKSLERTACQAVSGWVVQDHLRAAHLQKENQLDRATRFLLPLASAGRGTPSAHRLRDTLGIPVDKNVAIVIGSISRWSMTQQLLDCTRNWPQNWVLIVHDRYGRTSELLTDIPALTSNQTNRKIYISDASTALVDDMGAIFEGVSVGLAFYSPQYSGHMSDRLVGRNLKYLGLAAGKVSTYLCYGLPVIMNEIGMFADEARQHGFGCVAATPEQVKDCLDSMNLKHCAKNAQDYFARRLDFNIYKDCLYDWFQARNVPAFGVKKSDYDGAVS